MNVKLSTSASIQFAITTVSIDYIYSCHETTQKVGQKRKFTVRNNMKNNIIDRASTSMKTKTTIPKQFRFRPSLLLSYFSFQDSYIYTLIIRFYERELLCLLPFKNNVLVHSCSLPVFMNTIKEKFSHPPLLNTSRNAHIYALVPFMDIHHNNGIIKIKN